MGALIDGESRPRLESWLAGATGATRVSVADEGTLGGGAISLNLAVTLDIDGGPQAGRHACVLRAQPTGNKSGGGTAAPSMKASISKAQEFAVLRAAFGAGVAAPEPIAACGDPAVLGADFYIMRRAEGIGAGHKVVKSDQPQRGLARELGRQLGRLHRAGPDTPGLEGLPVPNPSPAIDCVHAYRDWLGDVAVRDAVLAWGLRWLEIHAPPPGDLVLCHRDYRTGNYLVKDGALTAILDWEFAGFSDPMEDLGWFCARSWRFGRHDREAGGLAGREDFYAGYEETSGRRVDPRAVAYWETAAYMRWAAIAVLQGRRHTSGEERSLELALTGRMLPEIELDLLRHIRSLGLTAALTASVGAGLSVDGSEERVA